MKIYLITFNKCDYDQYDGFVVVAEDSEQAIRLIKKEHPDEKYGIINWKAGYKIKEIIGEKEEIIMDSFNAG